MDRMKIPEDIIEACGGNIVASQILYSRGFRDVEKIRELIKMDGYISPGYKAFIGIEGICNLIYDMVSCGDGICIYGDYDTDGVTAAAILTGYLRSVGANVIYHTPDRFEEGYGMSKRVLETLTNENIKLVITCDCGIANVDEIKYSYELGMKVIVTDHHELPDILPACEGIINPKMLPEGHPMRYICGAATAYYLILALDDIHFKSGNAESYLDLVLIATVGDVVPVLGENRHILKKGMPILGNTCRKGLIELFHISRLEMNTFTLEDIAFQVVPRINAAGRLESAKSAVELLLCSDIEECFNLARFLNMQNDRRKSIQQMIIGQAIEMMDDDKNIIVLYKEEWHHGVIGIAASKLCEEFGKPVILMGLKGDKRTVTGSARSVEGISMFEILKDNSRYLKKFGGHSGAAGLSLDIDDLKGFMEDVEDYGGHLVIPHAQGAAYDIEVSTSDIGDKLYEGINLLAPFGSGFEEPSALCRNMRVYSDRPISNGNHRRLVLGDDNSRFGALWWNAGTELMPGTVCDLVFKVRKRLYKGREEIELVINDILNSVVKPAEVLSKRPCPDIVDMRGSSIEKLEGVIYYEGLNKEVGGFTRYNMRQCEILSLLSIPPSPEVFREVVAKANPKKIVLAFKDGEANINSYLKLLTAILKGAKERDGMLDVESIATASNQTERTVILSVQYLIEKGYLSCTVKQGKIKVHNLNNEPLSKLKPFVEDEFKISFSETLAFRKYIIGENVENIHKIIYKN